MIVIQDRGMDMPRILLSMYEAVWRGHAVNARGMMTRNVRNLAVVMPAAVPPITSFDDRKLSISYCKKEWEWYLNADKMDSSIEQHATMWAKLKQSTGEYYSNYGQYMFSPDELQTQFDYVVDTLTHDPDSRRARMVILRREHLFKQNTDTVCTYAINFTLESDVLHMTVMMRSNDVIFGFTNDAFCFWNLMQFVWVLLKERDPNIRLGTYTHFTNSMHVYERHFEMIGKILSKDKRGYNSYTVPMVTPNEVRAFLVRKRADGAYTSWLTSEQG